MGGGEDARSARHLAGTPQTVTGQGALCFASRVYSYCYVPRMRKSVRFCVCVMYLLGRREPTVATPTPYSLLLLELFIFPS